MQEVGVELTKGIECPQAFGEAFLLPKGGLIQAMVCKAIHWNNLILIEP